MSKIAVLLPRECMLEQARRVIREEHMDIDMLKVIKTADSVYEARNAVENGAGIIVARGVQASFIKTYLNVPLSMRSRHSIRFHLCLLSPRKIPSAMR